MTALNRYLDSNQKDCLQNQWRKRPILVDCVKYVRVHDTSDVCYLFSTESACIDPVQAVERITHAHTRAYASRKHTHTQKCSLL